ncbi:MAG: UDP-N-acetylglucosamine--N-acetylmuramyl-(pentapeptide) pyrophosphoryl-undecaprenol N-acetylglucosamine transferase [Actinobacteria bacterium]|nr:UDP-N-acetylglucosamine--N-acetylmuramyl-(pentapeptide) pyrophosphoryl-undecaprenol N-acetylglucosamine transferase [Actinomycetota bacterium]
MTAPTPDDVPSGGIAPGDVPPGDVSPRGRGANAISSAASRTHPIVIAGGGTAGHILPGLSIAEALIAAGVERDAVLWIGSARGQETSLVPPSGIELVALKGRGIQRSLKPRAIADNIAAILGLGSAFMRAFRLIGRRRPAAVLMLGGYASAAAAAAAVFWRVPIVIAEQNAVGGAANRVFGRFARAAAVPFDGSDLPRAIVTGNPVRDVILQRRVAAVTQRSAAQRSARSELGIPADRVVVAAFAGSLGSRRINEAIADLANRWSDRRDVAIYHVIGRRDWATFERPNVAADGLWYRDVEYENRMDVVLAAADVAVCRSGGTTVAELAVIGVPSLLVPLPIAPGDHQRHNAAALVNANAAHLVDDDSCTGEHLDELLGPIVAEPAVRTAMADAAWGVGRPDAASAVAALVLQQLAASKGA